ncbi:hypothetical protein V6N13_063683 [Hibiscus sabdariffa]
MYCRPVVGLDGCFLKGSFKGEILSEVRRDCNNQIFPIAWAMAEVENRKTWAWFLNNLQHDLGLGDGDGCTLLSDMQKGLLEEVPVCFPKIEHRFCTMHCMPIGEKSTKEVTCSCYSGSAARQQHSLSLQSMQTELQELYSVVLPAVASEQFWKDSGMGKIGPPLHRKMSGRPKHKRRREEGEILSAPKSTPTMVFMPTPAIASEQFWKVVEWERLVHLCIEKCQEDQNIKGKEKKVENHVPPSSQIPSASSSQTSRVPLSSEIQSPPYSQTSCVSPSSQISSHASSQTSHVPPSSQILSAPKSTPTMVFMPTPSIQQLSELVPVNQYKGTSNMREHVRAHSPKGEQLCKELAYTEMRKQDYRF